MNGKLTVPIYCSAPRRSHLQLGRILDSSFALGTKIHFAAPHEGMLSGTPGDHETFVRSVGAMYVMDLNPDEDDDGKGKSITRVQMELLATKTSQVNDCAY